MEQDKILLWVVAGLNLLIGLYSIHLKQYFSQKGKNLADKEDLEDLTRIVEQVRGEFQRENEMLKASLNIISNKRNVIFSEQKQSIIDFSTQVNIWMWDALKINVFDYYHKNHDDLSDKIIKLKDAYNSVQIAFSKVQLLIDDSNLVDVGHQTVTETLKLHNFVELKVTALKRNLSWERILVEQITSKDFDIRKAPQPMAQFYQSEAKDNRLERENLLKDYYDEYGKLFSPAISKRNEFFSFAKAYLNA